MWKALVTIVMLCGLWQWHEIRSGEAVSLGEEKRAELVEAAPRLLVRLGLRDGPDPEPAPARMVHCVVDGVGSFLRDTECRESGGAVDEPSWARTES